MFGLDSVSCVFSSGALVITVVNYDLYWQAVEKDCAQLNYIILFAVCICRQGLCKDWNDLNKKVSHFTLKVKAIHSFANLGQYKPNGTTSYCRRSEFLTTPNYSSISFILDINMFWKISSYVFVIKSFPQCEDQVLKTQRVLQIIFT